MDPTDTSSIHTALRETEEELGVPTDQWDVWGELPSFPDRVKGVSKSIDCIVEYLVYMMKFYYLMVKLMIDVLFLLRGKGSLYLQ